MRARAHTCSQTLPHSEHALTLAPSRAGRAAGEREAGALRASPSPNPSHGNSKAKRKPGSRGHTQDSAGCAGAGTRRGRGGDGQPQTTVFSRTASRLFTTSSGLGVKVRADQSGRDGLPGAPLPVPAPRPREPLFQGVSSPASDLTQSLPSQRCSRPHQPGAVRPARPAPRSRRFRPAGPPTRDPLILTDWEGGVGVGGAVPSPI